MDSDSRRPSHLPDPVRLHKFLAQCGLGSRRSCEVLILSGVVTVDGHPVTELGSSILPGRQVVRVHGTTVQPEAKLYLALNKPAGYVSTSKDPQGRPTVVDLVKSLSERLYTVGRLDRDSEGLLILTNDGDLANAMSHPRHHVEKVYHVAVSGRLSAAQRSAFRLGVESDGELLRVIEVRELRGGKRGVTYEVVLGEGRNRQLRRMFAAVGLKVVRLERVAIGPLRLGRIARGRWRHLTNAEVQSLRDAARPSGLGSAGGSGVTRGSESQSARGRRR